MNQIIPKGRLLIIGGAEDKGEGKLLIANQSSKFVELEILKKLASKEKKNPRIEVITTATDDPEKEKRTYARAFEKAGFKNVGFINIQSKAEARRKKFCERLRKADSVLFGGGDQLKIATILAGTDFAEALKDRYFTDKDFIVAGTSAGAMVISKVMIQEGGSFEALFESDLKTGGGIGLVENCIIDTHFIKRGRFGRLAHAVVRSPGNLGVGLGEDTAILIKNGHEAECLGSGMVVLIDGREIEETNINEVDEDSPMYVDNLRVHLLVKGCKFDLHNCKLKYPKREKSD